MSFVPWNRVFKYPFIFSKCRQEYAHKGPYLLTHWCRCPSMWICIDVDLTPICVPKTHHNKYKLGNSSHFSCFSDATVFCLTLPRLCLPYRTLKNLHGTAAEDGVARQNRYVLRWEDYTAATSNAKWVRNTLGSIPRSTGTAKHNNQFRNSAPARMLCACSWENKNMVHYFCMSVFDHE